MSDQKFKALEELTYEEALQELEELVAALETGENDLESTLRYFERGQALASYCISLLDKAELKVEEVSTLTLRPANDEAVMVAIKSMGIDELIKEDKYLSILLNAQLKDASLEKIEAMRKAVITALDERAAKLALENGKPQESLFARASKSY